MQQYPHIQEFFQHILPQDVADKFDPEPPSSGHSSGRSSPTSQASLSLGSSGPFHGLVLFDNFSSGHNMLVRVTQKHERDIQKLTKSMQHIVDVIEKLADYNPGLVNICVTKELTKFQDRVTRVTNATQQIHHRRLSVV